MKFSEVERIAKQRKGSKEPFDQYMPEVLSEKALREKNDDRYLSDMSMRIFMAGLSWKMVKKKWPQFEQAFFNFNPLRCSFIHDEEIEAYMQRTDIIRHLAKIKSIPRNAFMVEEVKRSHGSFGNYIADWPVTDIVGLWADLKKRGDRLGGMSGPMFLRITGKDTFLLSSDVVAALLNYKLIDQKPTSKKVLAEVQAIFNAWHEEAGRPMAEISRTLSMTV
jgi:3-methyladenine DNA glycosylase Tag